MEFLAVGERLDRLRPGSYLLKWTLFVRLALFWDLFDLAMAGVLLGFWLHSGASTRELNAAFLSATAFGMLVGLIATAALVDRIGRKAYLPLATSEERRVGYGFDRTSGSGWAAAP